MITCSRSVCFLLTIELQSAFIITHFKILTVDTSLIRDMNLIFWVEFLFILSLSTSKHFDGMNHNYLSSWGHSSLVHTKNEV